MTSYDGKGRTDDCRPKPGDVSALYGECLNEFGVPTTLLRNVSADDRCPHCNTSMPDTFNPINPNSLSLPPRYRCPHCQRIFWHQIIGGEVCAVAYLTKADHQYLVWKSGDDAVRTLAAHTAAGGLAKTQFLPKGTLP